jgi:hypothetical protein
MAIEPEADRIAKELAERALGVAGALRFFGEWFGGRPYENVHWLESASSADDSLVIRFDSGILRVWEPRGLELRVPVDYSRLRDAPRLSIAHASRVRWEWYFYGRPETPENARYFDYVVRRGKLARTSNLEPDLQESPTAKIDSPAVELL